MNDNDAEIMELVDEVRRCERVVQQAKNALEVAKRDAAVAACPYKEGDLVSGWDRDGTSPAKVDKILFTPSYPYYDLRVLPITEGQGRRSIWQRRGAWHRNMNVLYRAELRENERRKIWREI